jgi:ABC-type multidrug transport system fused ATPase/permease subunit
MDRAFLFDKGKTVEISSHEEVWEKKGIYHGLWQAQVDGFIGG